MGVSAVGPNHYVTASWTQKRPDPCWRKIEKLWLNFLQHGKEFLSALFTRASQQSGFSWKEKILDKVKTLESVVGRWIESNRTTIFLARYGLISIDLLGVSADSKVFDTVRFLLSNGWSIGLKNDSTKKTLSQDAFVKALIFAATNGDLPNLRLFLSEGRSVLQKDLESAVGQAASEGHVEVLRFLLSQGRRSSQEGLESAIGRAANRGHLEVVRYCLSEGRTISRQGLKYAVSQAGFLHHLEVVRFLLSEGRTLHEDDKNALILQSAEYGRGFFLEILLAQGPILRATRNAAVRRAGRALHDPNVEAVGIIRDMLNMAPLIPDVAFRHHSRADIRDRILRVTLSEIERSPEAHLQTICEDDFPESVILLDHPRAIDLGGVTKQFITTLMGALRPKLSLTEARLPVLRGDEDPEVYAQHEMLYSQLGKFYALMDKRNEHRTDKFVTGDLFSPAFFQIIKIVATERPLEIRRKVAELVLAANPSDLNAQLVLNPRVSASTLEEYRQAMACDAGEELQTAQGEIDAFVEAARVFYHGANQAFQRKICSMDPVLLARQLQGEPVSKEVLLRALKKDARLPEERFRWIQERIQSSDEAWRICFVKAITGNATLSPGMKISIAQGFRGPGVFELHTCHNSLDIPVEAVSEDLRRGVAEEVLTADPENVSAKLVLGHALSSEALQAYRIAVRCRAGHELEAASKEIDKHQFITALDAILVGEGYNIQ